MMASIFDIYQEFCIFQSCCQKTIIFFLRMIFKELF